MVRIDFMIMSLGGLSGDHVKRHKAQDPGGDLPEMIWSLLIGQDPWNNFQ